MSTIEIENGVVGYADVVNYVIKHGERRAPRGLPTLDAGELTVIMYDVSRSLPLGVCRDVNRRVAAAEAVQLIGGFSDPRLLITASPNFQRFLEPDTQRFYGAYGDRVRLQVPAALHKLRADPATRQAVITLWDPWLDNLPGHRDYPCTVALHFELKNDQLHLRTTMRSQDVWLGSPYDWFQFTQLQQTAARALGVSPGPYRHTTWSTHIYEADVERVEWLRPAVGPPEWQPRGLGSVEDNFHSIMMRARTLPYSDIPTMTMSECWYRDQLTPLTELSS